MVFLILCVLAVWPAASLALTEVMFTSNIDHNAEAPISFKLQYFIDKTKWEAGGPILFYCGGWENIEEDTRNMVTPQLMAKELKAAVVYAEHRYYGKSLPFTDSFKNAAALKYLQVKQVLADYKALAVFLRANLGGESKIRVPMITVGGGYSGILATWLRAKYPDVIDGAWASSAPMRAFHGYAIDVGACDQSIREIYTGATDTPNHYNCTMDQFRTAFATVDGMGNTPAGLTTLNRYFSLKPPLSSQAEVVFLKEFIRVALIEMASANLPYAANVKEPLGSIRSTSCQYFGVKCYLRVLQDVCFFMSPVIAGKDKSRALLALKHILKSYYNSSGEVSDYCVTPSCPRSDEEVAKRWQACTQLPLWECSQRSTNGWAKWLFSPARLTQCICRAPPNDFFWPACTKDTFESTRKAQCNAQFGDVFGWDESMFQLDYVSSTQQAAWNAGKDVPDIGNFNFTVMAKVTETFRGSEKIGHEGHLYTYQRSMEDGTRTYRCSKKSSMKCNARLYFDPTTEVYTVAGLHMDEPDPGAVEAEAMKANIRKRARETHEACLFYYGENSDSPLYWTLQT